MDSTDAQITCAAPKWYLQELLCRHRSELLLLLRRLIANIEATSQSVALTAGEVNGDESLCVNNLMSFSLQKACKVGGTTQQVAKLIWMILGLTAAHS
ncbi:hypothetical protein HUJ05_007321 [Dendroctonus ponderosae]|nr:hypothetical protein HUJ05_007321 [Dendroctonus ponderosae]